MELNYVQIAAIAVVGAAVLQQCGLMYRLLPERHTRAVYSEQIGLKGRGLANAGLLHTMSTGEHLAPHKMKPWDGGVSNRYFF